MPKPDWGQLESQAVLLLSRYLQIDTTNPPGNETAAGEFFKAIFDAEGIEARVLESAPGRGNVYARLRGDGSRKPSENELAAVRFQGRHVAQIAAKLSK